jgi:hypothetical protein
LQSAICQFDPHSLAHSAGEIGKEGTLKEGEAAAFPINPVVEQTHRREGLIADIGTEDDPVGKLVEPILPIQRDDVGVLQSSLGDTISSGLDAGFLQRTALYREGGESEEKRCDPETGR